MLGTLFLLLAAVVIAGALAKRARVRRTLRGEEPVGSDDPVLREILSRSDAWETDDDRLDDDSLDEDRIREEEDRFWEQEWDDPEEWRG